MAELQAELNRRVQTLCERQKNVEEIDQKLIGLVNEQEILSSENNSVSSGDGDSSKQSVSELQALKETLAKRTDDELQKIEEKKLG